MCFCFPSSIAVVQQVSNSSSLPLLPWCLHLVCHDTMCTQSVQAYTVRLTPPAHAKVDMTQPAVTTRQSNSQLLNADFKMLFKADSATITDFEAQL